MLWEQSYQERLLNALANQKHRKGHTKVSDHKHHRLWDSSVSFVFHSRFICLSSLAGKDVASSEVWPHLLCSVTARLFLPHSCLVFCFISRAKTAPWNGCDQGLSQKGSNHPHVSLRLLPVSKGKVAPTREHTLKTEGVMQLQASDKPML